MIASLALLAAPVALAEAPADIAPKVLEGLELHHDLTLTSPGAEPRQVVRFAPQPGSKAHYELATSQKMSMSMEGVEGDLDLSALGDLSPTIVMSMTHEVEPALANGLVPVRVSTGATRVENVSAELKETMQAAVSATSGLGYRMLVRPDGIIDQVDVSIDDPALFEATQSMVDQYLTQTPTFPTEPIGVGATWTTDLQMGVAGIELLATQTMTVTRITDDDIEMNTQFAITRADGPTQLPGLPPGAKVDITRLDGSGAGSMRTDLTTMASTGTTTSDVDIAVRVVGDGGIELGMEMGISQTTELRTVE